MPDATRNPEAAAQASRIPNLFHELFEALPALVVLTDPDGRIILFNAACEALTGYGRDEVIGRTIPELFLPKEWVPIVMQRFADLEASEVQLPHENPWITKSGERRMIEWRCVAFRLAAAPGPYVLGSGFDLSQRSDLERAPEDSLGSLVDEVARAVRDLTAVVEQPDAAQLENIKERLRASEGRFRAVMDAVRDNTLVLDRSLRISFAGRSLLDNLGHRPDAVIGRDLLDFVHPDERADARVRLGALGVQAHAEPTLSVRLWHAEGRWVQVDVAARVEGDASAAAGAVTGADGAPDSGADNDALTEALLQFKSLVEAIDEVFWVWEAETRRVVYVSPGFERVWGQPLGELATVFSRFLASVHDEDRSSLMERLEREARGERQGTHEYRIHRPDGSTRWIRSRVAQIRDTGGRVTRVVGISSDITEERSEEDRRLGYALAQRDAIVREVSHRIKNVVQGTASLLLQHVTGDEALDAILRAAAERVRLIAEVYGLQGKSASTRVDLCDLLEAIVGAHQPLIGSALAFARPADLAPVEVSVGATVVVALVLNELVANAVKHCTARGSGAIPVGVARGRHWVRVTIRNPGRLPEGFDFARGRGFGTGLSLVKSLLPPAGAEVRVYAQEPDAVVTTLELRPPVVIL